MIDIVDIKKAINDGELKPHIEQVGKHRYVILEDVQTGESIRIVEVE